MTDRVHSLTVVLERDMRTDDVESLENAIRMLKGVLSVDQHISDHTAWMAQQRAREALREQMIQVLWPKDKDNP